jgi:hypothetical protein
VLRQSLKLWIWPGVGKDLGVPGCDDAATFALESLRDNRCSAAPGAGARDLVNKVDQLIGESDRNLPAHPKTVPHWYRPRGPGTPGGKLSVSLRGEEVEFLDA